MMMKLPCLTAIIMTSSVLLFAAGAAAPQQQTEVHLLTLFTCEAVCENCSGPGACSCKGKNKKITPEQIEDFKDVHCYDETKGVVKDFNNALLDSYDRMTDTTNALEDLPFILVDAGCEYLKSSDFPVKRGQIWGGGALDRCNEPDSFINRLRHEHGADIVHTTIGEAQGGQADEFCAFSRYKWYPWLSKHEIGHLMGCGHDDGDDSGCSIMATNCEKGRINEFSNKCFDKMESLAGIRAGYMAPPCEDKEDCEPWLGDDATDCNKDGNYNLCVYD